MNDVKCKHEHLQLGTLPVKLAQGFETKCNCHEFLSELVSSEQKVVSGGMDLITACPRWQLRHPESRKVLRPLQVAGRCLESETGCNGCWSWRRGLGKLLGRELTKYQYYSVPEDSYLSLFQQFSACFTNLEERNLKPTKCHRPQLDGLLQVSLAGKMLIC